MKNFSQITENLDVANKKYVDDELDKLARTVNNGALTLTVNGTAHTFTANQSEDTSVTINDTGVTSVSLIGDGNAVTNASIDGRALTLTKGTTFLTSQSIKTLNTNNTTAQTTSASETIVGSGTINLHKIAKTGNYNDLLDKLTAGSNITINENNVISAKDTTYTFTANNPTLAWNTTSKIGTIGGVEFNVTMPANPNTHHTNYLQIKGNNTEAVKFTQNADKTLNFKPGANVSISAAANEITISATDTNTSHSHSAGVGLVGSGNAGTGSGTYSYKAKLRSETALIEDSAAVATVSGRVYPVAVDKSGYLSVNVPWNNTNTATAADNLLDGSNSGTQITYAPYTSQQSKLSFDSSNTEPTRSDRLNLNGYLHATKLYSGGKEVLTSHQPLPKVNNGKLTIQKNGTNVATFTANQSGNVTANITVPMTPFSSDDLSTGTYRSTNLPSNCSLVYIEDRQKGLSGYLYKNSGAMVFHELYFVTNFYTTLTDAKTTLTIYKLQINGTKVEKTYKNLFISSSGKVEVGTEYAENGTFYYKVLK